MQPKSLAEADATEPIEARTFGHFALIDRIGRGPTAEAHRAISLAEPVDERPYALKLFPEQGKNAPFVEAVLQVSRGALRVERPNMVQVVDAGVEGGEVFVALQYSDGFDLAGLLRRCGQRRVPLPLELGLHVVLSTLRGLEEAYKLVGADAVHGAVSPTNILIASDGVVRVSDFGLSKADQALPNAEEVFASRAGYMSPEQARREPFDVRADVFAVGVVLWELITGRRCYRPPRNGVGESLLAQALRGAILAPSQRGLRREEQLHDVLEHALAVNTKDRYESVTPMLADLEAYVVGANHDPGNAQLARWLKRFFGADLTTMRHSFSIGAAHVRKLPRPEPVPPSVPPAEEEELPPMRGRMSSDQELTLIECDEDLPQDAQDVLEAARRGDSRPPAHLIKEEEALAIPNVEPLSDETAEDGEEGEAGEELEQAEDEAVPSEAPPKTGTSGFFWVFLVLLVLAAIAIANVYLRFI